MRRTAVTKLGAALGLPLATFLFGKGYLWLVSVVGIAPHTIPCPMCHGSRAFQAFYSCRLMSSAEENLFVFVSLLLCNAIPALAAVAVVTEKEGQIDVWLRRSFTWQMGLGIFSATAILFALQWLINLCRWTAG